MKAFRSRLSLLAVLAITVSYSGCEARERPEVIAEEELPPDPATACLNTSPAPVEIAVKNYIENAEPKPWRFLNAASTDSALPELAAQIVHGKGPTFYWLPDEKSQAQVREKLERDGTWPTMLVIVREDTDHGDGNRTVTVGGHYIGKPHHGTVSPNVSYSIRCNIDSTSSWVLEKVSE